MRVLSLLLMIFTIYSCDSSENSSPNSGISSNPNFIRGTIQTSRDKPVFNALVSFTNASDTAEDFTDSNGVYEVNLIEDQSYSFKVSLNGQLLFSDSNITTKNLIEEITVIEDTIVQQIIDTIDTVAVFEDIVPKVITLTRENCDIQDAQIATGQNIANMSNTDKLDYNHGSYQYVSCGMYDYNTVVRALFQFSLDSLTTTAKIDTTLLQLTVDTVYEKNVEHTITLLVYPLLRPWLEGNAIGPNDTNSSIINGVTANERSHDKPWGTTGIGIDGVDAETTPLEFTFPTYSKGSKLQLNISPIMNRWLSGELKNNGILIVNKDEQGSIFYHFPSFASSECDDLKSSPTIRVVH